MFWKTIIKSICLINVMHFSMCVWTLWGILEDSLPTVRWSVTVSNNYQSHSHSGKTIGNDLCFIETVPTAVSSACDWFRGTTCSSVFVRWLGWSSGASRARSSSTVPSRAFLLCFIVLLSYVFCFHFYPFYLKKNVFRKHIIRLQTCCFGLLAHFMNKPASTFLQHFF